MAPLKTPSDATSLASSQEEAPRPNRAQNERNAHIFNEKLKSWREWLVDLQERLCRDLVAISLANRECLGKDPLDWVNECIDDYWDAHRPGFKNWAVLCCDWAEPKGWSAPGWLLSAVPDDTLRLHIQIAPLAETLDGRLLPPYTEVILEQIASLIEMRILMARTAVLGDAKIKIASEPDSGNVSQSASSIERVNGAVHAMAQKYGSEWALKWFESTREVYAALHSTPSTTGNPRTSDVANNLVEQPKSKTGPKPRMDFHHAVADVVRLFDTKWKQPPNLERIAKELKMRKIPPLKSWGKRERPAQSWTRAVEYYPDVVRKALEYSLKMAARDIPEKPSETLGNLR